MGRKPNALILHYFHRGAKLEDASNRYQHTCKACGEVFPKGRIDSLQNHLTRKCPALSMQERTHVILQIHNVPSGASTATKKENAKSKDNKAVSLPLQSRTPQQTFDGLNVLAEASRQVGQVERRGSQTYQTPANANDDPMNMAIDPALDVFPTNFPNTFDHELGSFSQSNVAQSGSIATVPPLPHLPNEHTEDENTHEHPIGTPPPAGTDVSMSNQPENDLSTIAADASELLPTQTQQINDPQAVHGEVIPGTASGAGDITNEVSRGHEDFTIDESGKEHGLVVEEENPADLGATGADGHLPGGDMKTQSIGDSTNALDRPDSWVNIDGPNFQAFWQEMQRSQPRVRTAIPQPPVQRPIAVRSPFKGGEFGEFSLDTHPPTKATRQKFSAERRKEVQDVRKKGACLRCRMLRKPCSLESPCATCRSVESARLWKEPCMRVRITEMFDLYTAGLHASLAYRDINLVKGQLQFEHLHGQIQITHFDEPEDCFTVKALQGRVDGTATGLPLLAAENIALAVQDVTLLDGDNEDLLVKVGKYLETYSRRLQENEPSHILRCTLNNLAEMFEETNEPFLEDTLQLWTATHVLCDVECRWRTTLISAVTQENMIIDETSDALSYSLITSQLRAMVEKRAAQLSKKVLQNFEKRLMHNKRDFDMFLVSLVLLNCVERTSWLFHTWENEAYASRWPLERKPGDYWVQGERFSNVLHMVLKMRVVPPKTSPRPDNSVLMPVDVVNENVLSWFDAVQLTPKYLNDRQNSEFDPLDSRSFDLKYSAKILLPQNCHT